MHVYAARMRCAGGVMLSRPLTSEHDHHGLPPHILGIEMQKSHPQDYIESSS